MRQGRSLANSLKGSKRLRAFYVGEGVPPIPEMVNELQEMTDVLLGRVDPPETQTSATLALMEVADAFYSRAAELTRLLQQAEREGRVTRGSAHYKFRTGELRTFMEMAKQSADMGSRRLTDASLEFQRAQVGRESR